MKMLIILVILGTLIMQTHSKILITPSSEYHDRSLELDKDENEIVEMVKTSFKEVLTDNTLFDFEIIKDEDMNGYKSQKVANHDELAKKSAQIYVFLERKQTDDQNPIVLFWMFVFKKEEKPTTDESKLPIQKKQKKRELSFEFTNSIVSSRIKIEFGFGDKALLQGFIKRSSAAFAQKVEQSVFGLGTVEPELSIMMDSLNEFFSPPKKDDEPLFTFSKPSENDSGKFRKLDFQVAGVESSLEFAAEKHPDLDAIIKEFNTEGPNLEPSHKDEYLIYKIEPKFDSSDSSDDEQDYSTYIDSFYLILVHANRKLTIIISSKHLSESVEISIKSKHMVIQTVYSLLYNLIYRTFAHFVELDSASAKCSDLLVYLKTKIKENPWKGLELEEDKFQIKIGKRHYLEITFTPNADDILTKIIFFKVSDDKGQEARTIGGKQAYFPLKSQYCMSPFILSFIEKTKQDFAKLALSELIRNPITDSEEELNSLKEILGSRYGELFIKDNPIKDQQRISLTGRVRDKKELGDCQSLKTDGQNLALVLCKKISDDQGSPATLEYVWATD